VTLEGSQPGRSGNVSWRRDPAGPFDDLKREDFARARAKGGSIKASSNVVGIVYTTGIAWERHPAMLERIRELRQGAEDFVGASTAWVIQQLKVNVDAAREQGAYKASNEAISLIYKIMSEDKEIGLKVARSLPHTVSGNELQARLKESFNQPSPSTPRRKQRSAEPLPPPPPATIDTEGEDAP
jgi:hypothetical protein